jgi:hypothetical protein
MHMAHPPLASAAIKSENELSFDEPHSEVTLARDVLRSDGLNAIEQSEREAALDENRSEEAAIFERAASRLRPSWSEADQMLDLGLAHAAVPEVVMPVAAAPVVPSNVVIAAPASFPAIVPSTDASYASSSEITDGFPTQARLIERARGLFADKRYVIAAAALGCIALGCLWAAVSGGEQKAPAAQAPVVAAPAPSAAAPAVAAHAPASVAATPPANAAPAPARELTREEAAALLGVVAPAKPAAKAPAKKPLAAKPGAKGAKQAPAAAAKKPATKR